MYVSIDNMDAASLCVVGKYRCYEALVSEVDHASCKQYDWHYDASNQQVFRCGTQGQTVLLLDTVISSANVQSSQHPIDGDILNFCRENISKSASTPASEEHEARLDQCPTDQDDADEDIKAELHDVMKFTKYFPREITSTIKAIITGTSLVDPEDENSHIEYLMREGYRRRRRIPRPRNYKMPKDPDMRTMVYPEDSRFSSPHVMDESLAESLHETFQASVEKTHVDVTPPSDADQC